MNKLMIGALSASMLLGAAAAFAQGMPEPPPVYGSVWTANKVQADRALAAARNSNAANQGNPVKPQVAVRNGASGG